MSKTEKDIHDYSHIDTTGSTITTLPDGKFQITLDKRVTSKAFKEILEYLYTDRVRYDLCT